MKDNRTVYYLDRPGAWGEFGLGVLMVVPITALVIACVVPGGYHSIFPNAPRERDPLGLCAMAALVLGLVGGGVYFLVRAVRTLRDRAPKLELRDDVLVDHRSGKTVAWADVLGTGYAIEREGSRLRRAVVTLAVRTDFGTREVAVDVRRLSASPESVIDRVRSFAGRG